VAYDVCMRGLALPNSKNRGRGAAQAGCEGAVQEWHRAGVFPERRSAGWAVEKGRGAVCGSGAALAQPRAKRKGLLSKVRIRADPNGSGRGGHQVTWGELRGMSMAPNPGGRQLRQDRWRL